MTAGYTLANDSKSITYSKATSAKTLATIKGAKSTNGLSVNDNVIKLKKSALASKVTLSGSYEFDFQSDYKKATITGSGSADTITVRGSYIKLNGGAGADSLFGAQVTTILTAAPLSSTVLPKAIPLTSMAILTKSLVPNSLKNKTRLNIFRNGLCIQAGVSEKSEAPLFWQENRRLL